MDEQPKSYEVAAGLVPSFSRGAMGVGTFGLVSIAFLLAAFGALAILPSFLIVGTFTAALAYFVHRAVRAAAHPSPYDPLVSTLELNESALVLRRPNRPALRVRHGDLVQGHLAPASGGAFVTIEPRFGRTIVLWVRSIDEGRALLDDAGLSAAHRPATFSFFFDMRVTVGADGVLVRWPLLRRRIFLSHKRIDDVRWKNDRIVLVLVDGDHYEINTGVGDKGEATQENQALLERLLEARKAYVATDAAVQVAALERNTRTALAWVTELRSMGAGGQYRSASLPADALYRIAVDPTGNEEHRIGAALALRSTLDAEGRERLRLAAASSASPKVRVVLSAAADEEDDEVVASAIEKKAKMP